jgi:hypothetical protein
MIKQIRDVQPPHKGSRISVAQARRAFRQVLGGAPKPDFEGVEGVYVRRADGGYSFVPKEDAVGAVQKGACRCYASEEQDAPFRKGDDVRSVEKSRARHIAAGRAEKAGA